MTSGEGPQQPGAGGAGLDHDADHDRIRALVDRLRTHLTLAVDAWEADVVGGVQPSASGPSGQPRPTRPATVPPVRMEQLHRTPEPTADLDDLVDVLAPRLLERLVPALREALLDDPRS